MGKDDAKLQTLTGVKCAFSVSVAKKLADDRTFDDEKSASLLVSSSPGFINPLFAVPGIDGHRDTPVDSGDPS